MTPQPPIAAVLEDPSELHEGEEASPRRPASS